MSNRINCRNCIHFNDLEHRCCLNDGSVDNQMVLHIDTDFKNYADENEFLGYSRYEEDYNPTLYFFKTKKLFLL